MRKTMDGSSLQQRLQGDWAAGDAISLLSEESIDYMLAQWAALPPLIRSRLLLSPLFARRKALQDLHPTLHRLAEAARDSQDEWVRLIGAAVGPYDGTLHLQPVVRDIKLVAALFNDLDNNNDNNHDASLNISPPATTTTTESSKVLLYRPSEEVYFNPELREKIAPGSSQLEITKQPKLALHHFTVRDPTQAPSARVAPPLPSSQQLQQQKVPVGGRSQSQGDAATSKPQPSRPFTHNDHNNNNNNLFMSSSSQPRMLVGGGAGPRQPPPSSSLREGGGLFLKPSRPAATFSISSDSNKLGAVSKLKPKKAAVIDVNEVTRLNKERQLAIQRQKEEEQKAKEREERLRQEAKELEKTKKEEARKKREEEEAEKRKLKAEEKAAEKEHREAEKAAKETEKRVAAEARLAAREAKMVEKAAKAAEREAKKAERREKRKSGGGGGASGTGAAGGGRRKRRTSDDDVGDNDSLDDSDSEDGMANDDDGILLPIVGGFGGGGGGGGDVASLLGDAALAAAAEHENYDDDEEEGEDDGLWD
jgi:hypothetical protein